MKLSEINAADIIQQEDTARTIAPENSLSLAAQNPDDVSYLSPRESKYKYDGTGSQIGAAVESFFKAGTLGTSTAFETKVLSKAFPKDFSAEAIRGREEENPLTAFGAGVLGGGALLAITGGVAAPLEGALALRGAGALASRALAYGTEGAIFGAGNLISEAALGDTEIGAQKVLANLAGGAVFGAALGSAITGIEAIPALRRASKLTEPFTALAPIIDPLAAAGIPRKTPLNPIREEIAKGFDHLKPHAEEIREAGKALGVITPEGMLTSDPHIQKLDFALINSPTPLGQERAQLYNQSYSTAAGKVAEALGSGSELSASEVGSKTSEIIENKFTELYEPIKRQYAEIEKITPLIPINEEVKKQGAKQIEALVKELGVPSNSVPYDIIKSYARDLGDVDNIKVLQNYITGLRKSVPYEAKFAAGKIRDILDEIELKAISSFGESAENSVIKQSILSSRDKLKSARQAYRGFSEKLAEVGRIALKDEKIHGFEDFLDKLNVISHEQFAKNLFAKNNVKALDYVHKEFPEVTRLLSQFDKQRIINKSVGDNKNIFSPVKALTDIRHMSKELKAVMFTSEELEVFKHGQVYFDNVLPNFNPSGTAGAAAYMDAFDLSKPIESTVKIIKNTYDSETKLTKIQKSVPYSQEELGIIHLQQQKASMLRYVAKGIQATTEAMDLGAKAIFKGNLSKSTKGFLRGAALEAGVEFSDKHYASHIKRIQTLVQNPTMLMDDLAKNTGSLHNAAPNLAAVVTTSIVNTLNYLNSKIPAGPQHMYLAPDWEPSYYEKIKFQRTFNAVSHPVTILEGIKRGSLTNYEVEAVQLTSPKLFMEMQHKVMEQMTPEKTKELEYAQKLSLAKFLGQPLDSNMLPQSIQANQMAMNPEAQPKQPGAPKKSPLGGLKAIKQGKRVETLTQRERD